MRRARILLWASIASYSLGYSAISILRHRSFNTGRFDLGNMVQAVDSTAHGHFLEVTALRGDQISRLGAHVDPILALFAPLWWLWPSPELLLAAQTVAIALGAVPVFRLARRRLGSERAGLGFALAYLLYPAVEWLTIDEFHPVALATPLLLWGIEFLDEGRVLAFAVVGLLAAATKEEVGLVVGLLGAWYWLRRRERRGLWLAACGIAASVIAIALVIPHFRNGGGSAFYGRYSEVGGSPAGILKASLTRPWHVVAVALDERGLRYLLELLWPLALLPLAAPLLAAAMLPELAINLLSETRTQTSIHFHYTGAILPVLVGASVLGAGRLRRHGISGEHIALLAVAVALFANYRLGPLPIWRFVPGGQQLQSRSAHVSAHDRIAARAVALVPGGAVLSVSNSLGAHLSARRRVLSFPRLLDATWIAVDERSPGYLDRLAPLPYAQAIAKVRRDPRWQLVFEQDGVLLFRHRA